MELTWIGGLLIPLGAVFFVVAPNWLYYLMVISVPFAATSLLNSASGSPLFAIQFLGALWILRYWGERFIARTMYIKQKNFKRESASLYFLWLFAGIVLATMIMPFIINGDEMVIRGEGTNIELVYIELTLTTIKQVLPVLFGTLLATTLAMKITTSTQLRKTLRIYVISVVFVAIWGMLQFFLVNVLHMTYPSWVFNTSTAVTTLGYMSETAKGYVRISSTAFESSMFAKQLLVVIPLLFYGIWVRTTLFGRTWDRILIGLLTVMVLLSTATTGFIGLPIVFGLTIFFLLKYAPVSLRSFFFYLTVSCFLLAGVYYLLPNAAVEIISEMLINKNESNSALIRLLSLIDAWEYFIKYPILGVGWSFVTSHDLVVSLLANSGVLGLMTFSLMSLQPILRTLTLLKLLPHNLRKTAQLEVTHSVGLASAQLLLIILAVFVGYEFYLAYSYVTLGLLYAANSQLASLIKNSEGENREWRFIRKIGIGNTHTYPPTTVCD